MQHLVLQVSSGVRICVSTNLFSHSTYVLFEQEDWFEKEIAFVRALVREGMRCVDIGANVGVYALEMAKLAGPSGRVAAFEPAADTMAFLRESARTNGFANMDLLEQAVSAAPGKLRLNMTADPELRSVTEGEGVEVEVVTLDQRMRELGWPSLDFVKIDAEGEEARIVDGAAETFRTFSPIVMYELKAGATFNEGVAVRILASGFQLFRVLAGAPVLVPMGSLEPVDDFELNAIAVKPDRVAELEARGLLAQVSGQWRETPRAFDIARDFHARLFPAGAPGMASFEDLPAGPYKSGLVAYANWRSEDLSIDERCCALRSAVDLLGSAVEEQFSVARGSSCARAALDWGARTRGVAVLQQALAACGSPFSVTETFVPASRQFEAPTFRGPVEARLSGALADAFEWSHTFSSLYSNKSGVLDWLAAQPFASKAVKRRAVLLQRRAEQPIALPPDLREASADHLNATFWPLIEAS